VLGYVFLGLAMGGLAGFALGYLWAYKRHQTALTKFEKERNELSQRCTELEMRLQSAEEKNRWLDQAQALLQDTFKALASDALAQNAQQLLHQAKAELERLLARVQGEWGKSQEELKGLVNPLREAVNRLEQRLGELEKSRKEEHGSLTAHLQQISRIHQELRDSTDRLQRALRSPTARGRWGEMQLRRIVELAGLQRHIDFVEQVGTDQGRPDLIVHLPNGGKLAVDAKAPMDAFLRALEASDEEARRTLIQDHANQLLRHLQDLGRKEYWRSLQPAPDLVVMFVPSESCIAAAFEVNPDLLEEGWRQRVLLASPTVLFALLKTVAYAWQQHEVAEEAEQLARDALELYRRFAVFGSHFQKLGERLAQAAEAYNAAAGSVRRRFLPLAQRFSERTGKDFPEPEDVPPPTPFSQEDTRK